MSKISCQTPFKIRNSPENTRKYNKQVTLFYTPLGWRTMHFLWKSKPKILIWWIIQFYLYQYLPTFCLVLFKRTSLCIAILLYLCAFVCSRNIPYLKHTLWVVTKLTLKGYVHQIAPHPNYSTGIIPLFCITASLYLPFGRDLKGAQAWDIRYRVIYTERSHLGRRLEERTKKTFSVWGPGFATRGVPCLP